MKRNLLLLFSLVFHIGCFAQILFEEGYFINNANEKTSCFIKNNDWKHNPSSFEYKLEQNAEVRASTIEQVKEFSITGRTKYTRYKVKVDRSSENLDRLSRSKQPEYQEDILFLKSLVVGKGNLFSYESAGLERYFYSLEEKNPQQLVFKSYFTKNEEVKQNKYYQQQLWNDLKCSSFSMEQIAKVDYKKKQLINFFVTYNQCQNTNFTNYEEKAKQKSLKLSIRPGLMITALAIQNEMSQSRDWNFGSQLNYRLGLEAEFTLPFNNNKWSIIAEPTYHSYTVNDVSDFEKVKVNYNSIEIPLGLRHYFFLNEDSKLFLNGAFVLELPLSSNIDYEFSRDLDLGASGKSIIGIGYNIKNKYSAEVRLGFARSVLSKYSLWNTDYKRVALIFGYKL